MDDDIVLVRPVLPPAAAVGKAVAEVFTSRVLTNDGPRVRRFEKLLAAELGLSELAVCASGTTAIQLGCAALGLTGEVLVPAAAFPAVCQAVLRAGGKPVAVDVEPDYLTIDPAAVQAAITPHTRAILAVHTFGCPADVDVLAPIAAAAGIPLICDGATGWGVSYHQRPLLSYGDVATLSLHAMKLTHAVEGGAVLSPDRRITAKVRRLRNFGIGEAGALPAGTNARMSEVHAAVGTLVLAEARAEVTRRTMVRQVYEDGLRDVRWLRPVPFRPGAGPNVAAMAVRLDPDAPLNAGAVCEALQSRGVHARAYFAGRYRPRSLPRSGPAPVADAAAGSIVCLPFWGGLTEREITRVVDALTQIGSGHRRRGLPHAPVVQPARGAAALVPDGPAGLGGPSSRA
jgi:dTDP-4-amino-4,6-dideoxygalactose transaminase